MEQQQNSNCLQLELRNPLHLPDLEFEQMDLELWIFGDLVYD